MSCERTPSEVHARAIRGGLGCGLALAIALCASHVSFAQAQPSANRVRFQVERGELEGPEFHNPPSVIIVVGPELELADAAPLTARLAREGLVTVVVRLTRPAEPATTERTSTLEGWLFNEVAFRWQHGVRRATIYVGGAALGATLATSRDERIILLDPPDWPDGAAFRCADTSRGDCHLGTDVLVLRASSPRCSGAAEIERYERTVLGHAHTVVETIPSSTRCDALGSTSAKCAAACGAQSPAASAAFAEAIVSFIVDPSKRRETSSSRPVAPAEPLAHTQGNLSFVAGLGLASLDDQRQPQAAVVLGLRPEITFGRSRASSIGVGAYLEGALRNANGALRPVAGAGTHLVLPTGDKTALAPSLGVSWNTYGGYDSAPALRVGVALGRRMFVSYSAFDFVNGLRIDATWGFGAAKERAATLAWQFDLAFIVALFTGH